MSKKMKLTKKIAKQEKEIKRLKSSVENMHNEQLIMLAFLKGKGLMPEFLELFDEDELPFY